VVPVVALADAPHLRCGVPLSGSWETIRVHSFRPVAGMSSTDRVTSYTVDEQTGKDVAATNGKLVQVSSDHGCNWSDSLALTSAPSAAQPFVGSTATIVSLALLGSTKVAAVSDGTRTHIMRSTGGAWTASDSGLPAVGTPKLLRAANDGRTLYLTLSPTTAGGGDGGTTGLPVPLPGGGGITQQTGLLYASTDRGASWTLRTTASDLPTGGTGFTQLDIDPSNTNRLYGLIGGRLAVSQDGGASFLTTTESDFTALTALNAVTVAAFRAGGKVFYSATGGTQFSQFPAPANVTSAAFRQGDASILVESGGQFTKFSVFDNLRVSVPAPSAATSGTLLGDRSTQGSFHALSGHSLLRFVDPVPPGTVIPPIAVGDTSVPPPVPGVVVPAVKNVTLNVGNTGTESFTLNLPKNPTPLDLVFLVDASGSQVQYIETLKSRIKDIVNALTATKLDLKVGVATLGAGPGEGDQAYPDAYVFPPDTRDPLHPTAGRKYVKPVIYHRIRAVGSTGPTLQKAIDAIQIESDGLPPGVGPATDREGALLALSQLVTGSGIHTYGEDHNPAARNVYTSVPPGQQIDFRPSSAVRRVVVLSTDEPFDTPYPQKKYAEGRPIFTEALRDMKANHVQVIGLSGGQVDALDDLRHVASGTGTFAPPGGVVCDNGNVSGTPEVLKEGEPLVCNTADHFAEAIIRLLSSLVDRQSVKLVPLTKSPVLGALQGRALTGLNVKQPNRASFQVTVSCVDVKPGVYPLRVAAVLRGTQVGSTRLNVTCVKALAAVPPKPLDPAPPAVPPAPQPPPPAIPPPAPPAPAPQPQVQVQTQVQVNPMSAGALQEQQELQLALALNGTLKDDDPAFNPGIELAMVDRRKREHVQALYLLAFAMTACAGVGLARLRTSPEIRVRRAS
jgi:hypothetical protein